MGDTLTQKIKYCAQIFLVPLYALSYLMPRDRKIWVFGSTFGRRFSENPRYLYLYTVQHHKKHVRAVWISHNREVVSFLQKEGYEAYYYHSLKGIWFALRAGVYIFDNYSKDINFWQSGGALKINLWHGSGNKKTNYDNKFDYVRHPRNQRERLATWLRRLSDEKPYHYTLATSPAMADIFTSAFRTDKAHIIVEGYPRNDTLFPEKGSGVRNIFTRQEKELLKELSRWKGRGAKALAYMPTFRDSETLFFDVMRLDEFNAFLKEHNFLFVTKLHPKSKLRKQFEKLQYSNILNVDAEVDVYSFLKEIDLLITDYSSVYSDYMLTARPVVAFWFDWEQYTANTRDSYIAHDVYMPEKKAEDMAQLETAICEVLAEDVCLQKRMQSRARMFARVDGKSSARLYQRICGLAGVRPQSKTGQRDSRAENH